MKGIPIQSRTRDKNRIRGNRKREFVDDESFKIFPRNIDPLPETVGSEKYGRVRMLSKILDHPLASPGKTLGHKCDTFFFETGIDPEKHFFDARKRSEKSERSTANDGENISDEIMDPFPIDAVFDVSDIGGDKQERLIRIIEIGSKHMLRETLHGKRFFDIGKISVNRERRTRCYAGIERIIECVLQNLPDMERSGGREYFPVF